MKKFAAILLVLCMALCLASFASADEAINVYALKGPTGIGLVKVMNDNDFKLKTEDITEMFAVIK